MQPFDAVAAALLARPFDPAAWRALDELEGEGRAAVVERMKAEVDSLCRNEPQRAVEASAVLVDAAERAPRLLPLALRGRGAALHFASRSKEALRFFERAARMYEAQNEEVELARALRSQVDVLAHLGRSEEALARAERAREILERHGELKLLSQLELNVGVVYTRLDEYPEARRRFLRVLEICDQIGDDLGRAFAQFDLAVVEQNANEVDAAELCFRECRARLQEAGMMLHVADCDYSLAYLESRRGRFEEAIRGLEQAAELYRAHGKPNGPPLCDLDLAEIHLRLGAARPAEEHADRAAAAFERLGLEYELARAEVLAGHARVQRGARREGRALLERAGERFRALGNVASAAALEVQLAAVEIDEGRPDDAADRAARARRELEARELRLLADLAEATRARALVAAGRPAEARELLDDLLRDATSRAVFDVLVRGEALRLLSDARRALGDRPGATESLREAVQAMDQGYVALPTSELRMDFLRQRHVAYVDLSWDLADSGGPDAVAEALLVLEQSRSRSLGEALPGAEERPDDELRARRDRLAWLVQRRIESELRASDARGGPSVADDEIRRAYDDVKRLAAAREPRAAHAWRELSRRDLERARRPGETLLAYLTSRRGTRVFVSDDEGLADVVLPIGEDELLALRDRLWLHADKLRLGRDYLHRHRARLARSVQPVLARLGEALLEPILARIDGRPLVVVPFGVLHDVPFHALLAGGRPLIERCEASYGFSAASVGDLRSRPAPAGAGVVACAVPGTGGPRPLAHVEPEIDAIEERIPGAVRRVTPAELADGVESRAIAGSVLHVASHAFYEPREPVFSSLCLGERVLFAHDLLRTGLRFDLVVLAGCETGRKRRAPGEELQGLARAVLGAGPRAVLGSLWAVEDADALAFVRGFYAHLGRGADARRATALAQRELAAEAPHPCAWAPFALCGAPDVRVAADPVSTNARPKEVPT